MNKIISASKTFVFGEEEDEGYIHIVTPKVEVKTNLSNKDSKEKVKTIVENAIELSYSEQTEELR